MLSIFEIPFHQMLYRSVCSTYRIPQNKFLMVLCTRHKNNRKMIFLEFQPLRSSDYGT